MAHHANTEFVPLNIAVLTLSDTRTLDNDTSGDVLAERLEAEGHRTGDRAIIKDDIYLLRAKVSQWIADPDIQGVLITGGTGFTARDTTPEAVLPLFDTQIEGYGELFRQLSFAQIGSSTVQSRAVAGVANRTVIFCMPGSTGACRLAWDGIIKEQLDARHKPCNFVEMLSMTGTGYCNGERQ